MWADSHSRLTQCMKGTVSADYMWWVMRMACWGRLVWATRMVCWGRLVWGRGWHAGVASSGRRGWRAGVASSQTLRSPSPPVCLCSAFVPMDQVEH